MLDVQLIDGDLPERTKILTGNDVVIQRIGRRLQTHLGEYLSDKSVGVPWASWVAIRPFPINEASAWLRAAIETCPGVVRLDDWTGEMSGSTATFTGTVITSSGAVPIQLLPLGAPGSGNTSASFRLLTGPGRR